MIDILLWDVDGTLLDFEASENVSFEKSLALQNESATSEQIAEYKKINREYWRALERGDVTKEELYPGRFADWSRLVGKTQLDPVKMNADYQKALGDNPVLRDDTMSVLDYFKQKGYRQYVLTNGSAVAQEGKLLKTGIDQIMDDIFISEKLGAPKPQMKYYDMVESSIPGYEKSRAVMIGDSISSDIQGGNNAGVRCIWFNPEGKVSNRGLKIDASVKTLTEIVDVIEGWNQTEGPV